jgi:hypothetical protein
MDTQRNIKWLSPYIQFVMITAIVYQPPNWLSNNPPLRPENCHRTPGSHAIVTQNAELYLYL